MDSTTLRHEYAALRVLAREARRARHPEEHWLRGLRRRYGTTLPEPVEHALLEVGGFPALSRGGCEPEFIAAGLEVQGPVEPQTDPATDPDDAALLAWLRETVPPATFKPRGLVLDFVERVGGGGAG